MLLPYGCFACGIPAVTFYKCCGIPGRNDPLSYSLLFRQSRRSSDWYWLDVYKRQGFPCQLAYSGDIDITGFRRPASYFREVVFGLRKDPYITVQNPHKFGQHLIKTPWVISDSVSTWNWSGSEGNPAIVEIYSPGEEVELFVNGVSQGKKAALSLIHIYHPGRRSGLGNG